MNYLEKARIKLSSLIMSRNFIVIKFLNVYFLRRVIAEVTKDYSIPWLTVTDKNYTYWVEVTKTIKSNTSYSISTVANFTSISGFYSLKLSSYNVLVDCERACISKTMLDNLKDKANKAIFIDNNFTLFTTVDIKNTFPDVTLYEPSYEQLVKDNLTPKIKVALYKSYLQDDINSDTIYLKQSLTEKDNFTVDFKEYNRKKNIYDGLNLILKCTSREKYEYLMRKKTFMKRKRIAAKNEDDCVKTYYRDKVWKTLYDVNTFLNTAKFRSSIGLKKILVDKKVVFFVADNISEENWNLYFNSTGLKRHELITDDTKEVDERMVVANFKAGLRQHIVTDKIELPKGLVWTDIDAIVLVKPVTTIINSIKSILEENLDLTVIAHYIEDTTDEVKVVNAIEENVGKDHVISVSTLGALQKTIYTD